MSPITATEGQQLTMTVRCNEQGQPPGAPEEPTTCDTGMFFGGEMTSPAEEVGEPVEGASP